MAYPIELRQRVVDKSAQGVTQPQIAEALAVSLGWVNKILQCHAIHGTLVPPRKKPGRAPKLQEEHHILLREWIARDPSLTLAQLAQAMEDHMGVAVNPTNVFHALKAMGFSYKKNSHTRRTATTRHPTAPKRMARPRRKHTGPELGLS